MISSIDNSSILKTNIQDSDAFNAEVKKEQEPTRLAGGFPFVPVFIGISLFYAGGCVSQMRGDDNTTKPSADNGVNK